MSFLSRKRSNKTREQEEWDYFVKNVRVELDQHYSNIASLRVTPMKLMLTMAIGARISIAMVSKVCDDTYSTEQWIEPDTETK